jgi:thiamine-monophosphate kinase
MPPRSLGNSLARLGEFRLIRQLARRYGQAGPSVLQGIGDDAALIRSSPARTLVLTTDLLVEGIHFDRRFGSFEDIGYKAAVANLSDIAAMGGIPQYLLVALAVPPTGTVSDVEALYRGIMRAAHRHEVALVGGDTSASRAGWFLGITLTGVVEPRAALTRHGARVGDLLYVSGTLGDSAGGLALLRRKPGRSQPALPHRDVAYLIERHLRPTPRIALGRLLAARHLATAAIDLSDGLSGDVAHICGQSHVGVEIDATALPLSPATRAYAAATRSDAVRLALDGGEDYELLFTVSPRREPALREAARRAHCRVSRIGRIRPPGFGLRLNRGQGPLERLMPRSYEHFRADRR